MATLKLASMSDWGKKTIPEADAIKEDSKRDRILTMDIQTGFFRMLDPGITTQEFIAKLPAILAEYGPIRIGTIDAGYGFVTVAIWRNNQGLNHDPND